MKTRKGKGYNTWGLTMASKGEDNNPYILLWLGKTAYEYGFNDFFMKPYRYVWHYGDTSHLMIAKKEISFTIHTGKEDGFVSCRYGADKDFLMGKNANHLPAWHKMCSLPWMHNEFDGQWLLNIDGTEFLKIKDGTIDLDASPWDYPGHERVDFEFVDSHDSEIIIGTARMERRVWTRGTSWCSWMKYFFDPIVHTDMAIDFNKEVGPEKGSWKGGIVGMSINLNDGENGLDACKRFCFEKGYTFHGFLHHGKNNEIVYKNKITKVDDFEAEGQGAVI